ncbi:MULTISPECIES: HNH endonuclease [unclassified Paenibacillus]|uniref:HNH endonuclease n=1 Tax=unclassified Paenibacillus TaxID=185978 RepID=UPI002379DFAF|nr:HNH endonuclease signature motif containing protein [Paenibacillus sp. MAHUQ-63]
MRSHTRPVLELDTVQIQQDLSGTSGNPPQITEDDTAPTKLCTYCACRRPLSEFKRRTGKSRGAVSYRGACKACRKNRREQADDRTLLEIGIAETSKTDESVDIAPAKKKRRRRRSKAKTADTLKTVVNKNIQSAAIMEEPIVNKRDLIRDMKAIGLMPNRRGFIHMRGKTDNGRKWHQEIDPVLAITLVKERAAVVMNRHTIRRLYSNKEFRRLILERDQYTCRFCGQYGDTIDHMLPRAKGGHTTPDNCVCACNTCNQSKADRDMDEFEFSIKHNPKLQ